MHDKERFKWEEIAKIASITGPGMNLDIIDTTTLDVEGGYRTFIKSLRNGGTVVLAIRFTGIPQSFKPGFSGIIHPGKHCGSEAGSPFPYR